MTEFDVISLSSDSSRPSSPFINVSEVFNDSEKLEGSKIAKSDERNQSIHKLKFDSENRINTLSALKDRLAHNLSDSEDSESGSVYPIKSFNRLNDNFNYVIEDRPSDCNMFDSLALKPNDSGKSSHAKSKKRKGELIKHSKMTKEQRLEEKLRKQQEKEKLKADKLAMKELHQQMKPGNCIKHMTVIVDSTLINCSFGGTLVAAIQNSESKYLITLQTVPYSISWTRDQPNSTLKEESDVIIVWQWEIIIPAVKNHSLCLKIQDIQKRLPGKTISLVVYGLNGYYSYMKSKKKQAKTNEYPYVTRKEIEEELIELQIMASCNHRLIESPEDLGQLVTQITKSIAETPFKLDRQKRELESLEWFAAGDSRDCVAVDRAGNGLLRLWLQQLCQFNLAGHDTAQAIVAVYGSPAALLRAYDACSTQKEAEDLLKDIPIRRCQGPLSSSRKIGPELSKKIYNFFCSTDGDAPLSQGH